MARVLITGGAGFIGSHLTRACLGRGDEVAVLVRHSTDLRRLEDVEARVQVLRVDLTDRADVQRAIGGVRPDAVFHLAAQTRRPAKDDLSDVGEAIDAELQGLTNLLSALVETGPSVFVRTGSLAEYGPIPAPHVETLREAPANTYAAMLVCGTTLLQTLQPRLPFAAATARLALSYGADQSEGFLVPGLIARMLDGTPCALGRPDDRRDMIHVDDVVAALLRMAERPAAVRGRILNVSTGVAPTVRDIAETIRRILEADPALIQIAPDPAAVALPDFRADPGLAMQLLDWQPVIGLEAGLERTIAWARARHAGTEKAK